MLRVHRDKDGEWWLDNTGFYTDPKWKSAPSRVSNLAQLPDELAIKLTTLSLSPVGETVPDVGKRISQDTFWVYG